MARTMRFWGLIDRTFLERGGGRRSGWRHAWIEQKENFRWLMDADQVASAYLRERVRPIPA
ncbi:hypothetical protein ABIE78_002769 [Sinorhizobium fredii]|uniref:hypothetical protein n=1 Tax=Rhizobium fredii TaxID=380 RepID=UPI001CC238B2|nr:hypothetical protein [Sinorhizobium fredii]